MSGGGSKIGKKHAYAERLKAYLDKYRTIVVVEADNVRSSQMQKIRHSLRGSAELLMGKNTFMKRVLRECAEGNPRVGPLIPLLKNNVGFVFTNSDLDDVEKKLRQQRVGVPAKAGSIAPCDVIVPKGPTGLEPTQTSFLHILNVGSKIRSGQIDIINDVHLIKAGQKVGSSEAALLQKLNMKPFSYGLSLLHIYQDGYVREPFVQRDLDMTIMARFRDSIANIASLALSTGYAALPALPHALIAAYSNVLSVSISTEYSFPDSDHAKALLAAPSAPIEDVGRCVHAGDIFEDDFGESKYESDDEPMFDLFG